MMIRVAIVLGYETIMMTSRAMVQWPYTELPVARVAAALLPQVHPPG